MKHHVPGLPHTAHDSLSEVPDGMFLVRSMGRSIAGRPRNASICYGSLSLSLNRLPGVPRQPHLLHAKGDVEAGLVPAGFSR